MRSTWCCRPGRHGAAPSWTDASTRSRSRPTTSRSSTRATSSCWRCCPTNSPLCAPRCRSAPTRTSSAWWPASPRRAWRRTCSPATAITQLIPLPMIALHTGPVVMCPPLPRVAWLLDGCGEIVSIENEDHLVALSCASATMSTFLAFENTVIDWLLGAGLPARQARDYAATLFQGLATETLRTELDQRAQMPQEHETPGWAQPLPAHVDDHGRDVLHPDPAPRHAAPDLVQAHRLTSNAGPTAAVKAGARAGATAGRPPRSPRRPAGTRSPSSTSALT